MCGILESAFQDAMHIIFTGPHSVVRLWYIYYENHFIVPTYIHPTYFYMRLQTTVQNMLTNLDGIQVIDLKGRAPAHCIISNFFGQKSKIFFQGPPTHTYVMTLPCMLNDTARLHSITIRKLDDTVLQWRHNFKSVPTSTHITTYHFLLLLVLALEWNNHLLLMEVVELVYDVILCLGLYL